MDKVRLDGAHLEDLASVDDKWDTFYLNSGSEEDYWWIDRSQRNLRDFKML